MAERMPVKSKTYRDGSKALEIRQADDIVILLAHRQIEMERTQWTAKEG
jgi:hypothetical protein